MIKWETVPSRDLTVRISIVIPVFNGEATLPACLDAVKRSEWPVHELILIDDGSTDSSIAIANRYGANLLSTGGRMGPAKARNIGARAATGDLLVFLDADVAVHPDALARIARRFTDDPELDALMGAYDDAPACQGFVSQFKNLMHSFVHRQGNAEASTFWCGCGAVKRTVYFAHGGLDESYERPSIEDIELGYRMHQAGRKLALDPAIQAKHLKTWTLWNLIRTDVLQRGIPWTELILRTRVLPGDLNVSWGQRASILLTALFLILVALLIPAGAVACLLAVLLLNRDFYNFLASRKGWMFAFRTIPLHILYFFYSGVSFALGVGSHMLLSRPQPVGIENRAEWE